MAIAAHVISTDIDMVELYRVVAVENSIIHFEQYLYCGSNFALLSCKLSYDGLCVGALQFLVQETIICPDNVNAYDTGRHNAYTFLCYFS